MRRKLKYILPSIQIAIAVGLMFWGLAQDYRIMTLAVRGLEVHRTAPAFKLCDGISSPIRPLWYSLSFCQKFSLSEAGGWIVFLTLIALLWYWAGLNVSSWIVMRRLVMPSRRILRLPCDALLVFLGLLCAKYALFGSFDFENGIIALVLYPARYWVKWQTPLENAMDLAATICYLVWAVVLVVFFGRDFVKSFVSSATQKVSQCP
jgi:hypothetical protein